MPNFVNIGLWDLNTELAQEPITQIFRRRDIRGPNSPDHFPLPTAKRPKTIAPRISKP